MSSLDGFTILKNWQSTGAAISLFSSLNGKILFEIRVIIQSVDESALVVARIDSPKTSETIDLRGAQIKYVESLSRHVNITHPDGKLTVLREK